MHFQILQIIWTLILLSSACPPIEAYVPTPHENSILHRNDTELFNLTKRWYSVHTDSAWPIRCGKRPVRYCFKNKHSADHLVRTLVNAIMMWKPASKLSSMEIMPDVACKDGGTRWWSCVCSDETDDDALVISDGQDGPDESKWQVNVRSSLGYDYSSKTAGRHSLEFWVPKGYDPAKASEIRTAALRVKMAHELGHAMGLIHEHQRPDRDKWVWYRCNLIEGYSEAKQKIMDPANTEFESTMGDIDRMNRVCTETLLAKKYLMSALQFVSHDVRFANTWIYDDKSPFDYGSIMVYSSDTYRLKQPGSGAPLIRLPKPGEDLLDNPLIYQGGAKSWSKKSISSQDIKRIAMLYPGTAEQQADARALDQWQGLQLSVPGFMKNRKFEPTPQDLGLILPVWTPPEDGDQPAINLPGPDGDPLLAGDNEGPD